MIRPHQCCTRVWLEDDDGYDCHAFVWQRGDACRSLIAAEYRHSRKRLTGVFQSEDTDRESERDCYDLVDTSMPDLRKLSPLCLSCWWALRCVSDPACFIVCATSGGPHKLRHKSMGGTQILVHVDTYLPRPTKCLRCSWRPLRADNAASITRFSLPYPYPSTNLPPAT